MLIAALSAGRRHRLNEEEGPRRVAVTLGQARWTPSCEGLAQVVVRSEEAGIGHSRAARAVPGTAATDPAQMARWWGRAKRPQITRSSARPPSS
jgi:hypothetical protein